MLRAIKISLLCMTAIILSACALMASKTPFWFDAGSIDMQSYENTAVVLMPLAAQNTVPLDKDNAKELEQSLRTQFRNHFKIDLKRTTEKSLSEHGINDQSTNKDIAEAFGASAVLRASTFNVEQAISKSNAFRYTKIGLNLSFNDALDPNRYWRSSKLYQSSSGFNVKNIDFDYVLLSDLRKLKKALASTEKRNLKELSSGPSLIISALEQNISKEQAVKQSKFKTSAQYFGINISAFDRAGLKTLSVFNEQNGFLDSVDCSSVSQQDFVGKFYIPLETNENLITVSAINQKGVETIHQLEIKREEKKSVRVVVASSPYSVTNEAYSLTQAKLSTLNLNSKKRYNNLVYVDQTKISRRDFLITLEKIANEADLDDNIQPVLFFSGYVINETHRLYGHKLFLMLTDSEFDYLRSTALDLDEVIDLLGPNAFVVIEYCSKDYADLGDFQLRDKPVKINVYSCDRPVGDVSNRVVYAYEKNHTLEKIVDNELAGFESLPYLSAPDRKPSQKKAY